MDSFNVLSLDDATLWSKYIQKLPFEQQDIYFTPEYYKLFEELGEGKAQCFVFKKDGELALYPFLINSVNALEYNLDNEYYDIQGAYGYNGVVSNFNEPEIIDSFYLSFYKYCQANNIIAEFARFHPLLNNYKLAQNHMQVVFDRQTVAIHLDNDYEEIWKNEYSSKNRNMIRKAAKIGYSCDVLFKPDKTDIANFIALYIANMRAVAADSFYFFSETFFYNTFDLLKEHTYLFNIRNESGKLLCSSIVFKHNAFIHYHLSGRSSEADNSVNNYLLDEVVKFGIKNRAKSFHLGGGRTSAETDSLFKFKMNFSSQLADFYIGKKIHNKEIYDVVVARWEVANPDKINQYRHHLLKYRY